MTDTITPPVWRTVTQAAQVIGLSERQIRRQISTGKIPTKVNEAGGRLVDVSAKCHDNVTSECQSIPDKLRTVATILYELAKEIESGNA